MSCKGSRKCWNDWGNCCIFGSLYLQSSSPLPSSLLFTIQHPMGQRLLQLDRPPKIPSALPSNAGIPTIRRISRIRSWRIRATTMFSSLLEVSRDRAIGRAFPCELRVVYPYRPFPCRGIVGVRLRQRMAVGPRWWKRERRSRIRFKRTDQISNQSTGGGRFK